MTWTLGRLITQANGTTFANLDGTVRSLNPNVPEPPATYHWETRPAGTAGTYELCAVDGGTIGYNPFGTELLVYGFKLTVPNLPGVSAMTLEPLA